MNWFFSRFSEPSTYAGLALVFQSVPALIASKGMDTMAIGGVIGGFAAVVKGEGKPNA